MSRQPQLGMQPTTFANPLGINGFEFVEFAAPDPKELHELFRRMGFSPVARHRSKRDHAVPPGRGEFPGERGAGFLRGRVRREARPLGLRLRDPRSGRGRGPARGLRARPGALTERAETRAVTAPVIKGIGDCMLYLVTDGDDLFAREFEPIPGADRRCSCSTHAGSTDAPAD